MSKWTPGGIKLLAQSYSDSQWPWWDENSVLWSLESVLFPYCYAVQSQPQSRAPEVFLSLSPPILLRDFSIQRCPWSKQMFSDFPHVQWTFATISLEPVTARAMHRVQSIAGTSVPPKPVTLLFCFLLILLHILSACSRTTTIANVF